tara:strand:+ start:7950 stop:8903 length:954 start_codon:yes stop_codon:yes gene_type:complete
MKIFTHAVRYFGFPVLLILVSVSSFLLIQQGYNKGLILTLLSLATFVTLWWLEHLIPYQEKWNGNKKTIKDDLVHTFFGTGFGAHLGNTLNQFLILILAGQIQDSSNPLDIWPHSWPLWLQAVVVLLVADLGRYIQHRLHHHYTWLWKFHELHHNSRELNVFKTSRSHLMERVLQQICMYGPLLILGAPPEALLLFVIPNSFLGLFAHSNVDFRLGKLEYFFMGPHSHRLHHSIDMEEGNSNFGSATVIWDHVFGTFVTRKNHSLIEVGVQGKSGNDSFFYEIIWPFMDLFNGLKSYIEPKIPQPIKLKKNQKNPKN